MAINDEKRKTLRILTVDEDRPITEYQTELLLRRSDDMPDFPFSIDPESFENRDDAIRSVQKGLEAGRRYAVSFMHVRKATLDRDMETVEMIRKADPVTEIAVISEDLPDFHEELVRRVPPPENLMFLNGPLKAADIRHAAIVLGSKWVAGFPKASPAPTPQDTEKDFLFRLIMKNLPYPFFIKDRNGRYIHVNDAYARIFKISASERIGKTDGDFWSPEIVRELMANDAIVMTEKKILRTVELVTVKNVTRRYFTTKFPIIMDKTPLYLGGISICEPEKENPAAGREDESGIREWAESMPYDPTAVTHFLISGRTHMNGILGVCDLLKETDIDRDQAEYLNIVHVSALSMIELLNNIKDFSRMKSGELELENRPFSLKELLDDVQGLFFSDFSEKPIKMAVQIDPDVPDRLEADPLRLRQVLVNLVSNALRFTSRGEIRISVGQKRDEKTIPVSGEVLPLFSVRDTGIGIAHEIRDNLFEIFTHPDDKTVWRYGGTGLGLALCKQIIELMEGGIWVESEPGMGSVFSFWIKAGIVPEYSEKDSLPAGPETFSDICVLLAEDHPVNRRVAETILRNSGISVDTVVNGADAIEAVRGKKYDAVLMDIQMPVMNGIEATRIIRKELREKDLPIIAVTARDLYGDRKKCMAAGMNDYIAKPVDRKKLIDGLRRNVMRSVDIPGEKVGTMNDAGGREADESEYPKELPGLNIEEGLERLGGIWDLYADLVLFLCKDKKDFVQEITGHVEKNEFELARVKAHSLKGSAATVSATHLSAEAKKLEIACMDEDREKIGLALNSITDAFVQIAESAETIEAIVESEAMPPESANMGTPELLDTLEELLQYLKDADPLEVENSMVKIRTFSNSESGGIELGGMLKTLISETDSYDYEAATMTAEKIAGKLK